MDVAQTLWGNLQKGHQTAVDHRGSGTLAGEDVDVKMKIEKKKSCLKNKSAWTVMMQDTKYCRTPSSLCHLTEQSTSFLLVTWIPKLLPASQTNICKLYLLLFGADQFWPAVSENVIWERTKSFCLPSSGPGVWGLCQTQPAALLPT